MKEAASLLKSSEVRSDETEILRIQDCKLLVPRILLDHSNMSLCRLKRKHKHKESISCIPESPDCSPRNRRKDPMLAVPKNASHSYF